MKPETPLTADELDACPVDDCWYCSGERCAEHDYDPCGCAMDERHESKATTIAALRTQLEQARKGLEEIERIVTTTGGPQLHMIVKIRDAIARALSGEGTNRE
jgi:hypothetical protein